jgi:hypothetical protein
MICPIFDDVIQHAACDSTCTPDVDLNEKRIFLHLPFNPKDTPSQRFQQIFHDTLLKPPGEPTFPNLQNVLDAPNQTNQMIVAYHWLHNLKQILFPCRFAP